MNLNIKQNKKIRDKNYIRIINKKIQSYIKNPVGDLDLCYKPIKKLPIGLFVNGYLDIEGTYICELPKGLVIKESLFMQNTKISQLPDDIIIEGDFFCYNTPLNLIYKKEELKRKFKIKGKIHGNFF